MTQLTELEKQVHSCTRCKKEDFGHLVKYYPVYSFGDPRNRPLLVVGLNPSTREYEDNYLSNDENPAKRHESQLNYFNREYYGFFKTLEKFFRGRAREALRWMDSPWEKVGFIDLTKCPTRTPTGQWSTLKPSQKRRIIDNCEGFLVKQIEYLEPRLVMSYGADACRWFYPIYSSDDAFTVIKYRDWNVILVPQTQGGYPIQVIQNVQELIMKNL
jgi:uracil-DNA glycosylase